MITREKVTEYLNHIILEKNIDLKNKLSWGYFFTHYEKDTLKVAKNIFISEKYDFVEIIEENGTFHLHIEKIETHNIYTLYLKCLELYSLSIELGIDEFNGFDVEDISFSN